MNNNIQTTQVLTTTVDSIGLQVKDNTQNLSGLSNIGGFVGNNMGAKKSSILEYRSIQEMKTLGNNKYE